MLYAEKDLSELLICKEQELKELQAQQIHFQETTLQETRKQLQEMHRKFNSLKEDFTYNLKVLEERDKELEHFDTLFIQLKMVENANQAEASDLRIQVDKLQQALAQETKKQEALKDQYQRKLKEHQLALDQLHSSKDADISHYHEEYENMKQQLERKLQEAEGELALQRQELLVVIDTEIKEREHEFRVKADEMSNLVLSHELKVKLLTKELEALKEAGMKAADSLKMAEAANMELEKQVRCKDWEIKDITAIKDAQYCIIPLIKKGKIFPLIFLLSFYFYLFSLPLPPFLVPRRRKYGLLKYITYQLVKDVSEFVHDSGIHTYCFLRFRQLAKQRSP